MTYNFLLVLLQSALESLDDSVDDPAQASGREYSSRANEAVAPARRHGQIRSAPSRIPPPALTLPRSFARTPTCPAAAPAQARTSVFLIKTPTHLPWSLFLVPSRRVERRTHMRMRWGVTVNWCSSLARCSAMSFFVAPVAALLSFEKELNWILPFDPLRRPTSATPVEVRRKEVRGCWMVA